MGFPINRVNDFLKHSTKLIQLSTALVVASGILICQFNKQAADVKASQPKNNVITVQCDNNFSLEHAANKVFFRRHPERNGKLIESTERDFSKLSEEWWAIYDDIQQCRKSP